MKRILSVIVCLLAPAAFSQSLTFSLETSTTDGKSIVPTLTWTTTPTGATCTASGDWTGTKAASGTEILAAVTTSKSYNLACTWPGVQTAVVSWVAPTSNTDGSPLTNLAGFRVRWGNSAETLNSGDYIQDPSALTWTSPALAAGTWYFGVHVFNSLGLESELSNVASKVMTASATQTRVLEIAVKFPSPPVITIQ